MKKLISVIFIVVSYSVLFASSVPQWFTNPEKVFPSESYIRAIGEGDSQREAKSDALAELTCYFSQAVSSNVSVFKSLYKNDLEYTEKTGLNQNMKISSSAQLFTVQYTSSCYDRSNGKYYVCAFIERKAAWEIIKPEIEKAGEEIKIFLDDAEKEKEPLLKIIQLNKISDLYKNYLSLYDTALVIYPKRCGEFNDFSKKTFARLSELESLRKKIKVFIQTEGDRDNFIKSKIESVFIKNGISPSAEKTMYLVDVKINWNKTEYNGVYKSAPVIQVSVSKNKKTIAYFSAVCEKVSSYGYELTDSLAKGRLCDLVEERFYRECVGGILEVDYE